MGKSGVCLNVAALVLVTGAAHSAARDLWLTPNWLAVDFTHMSHATQHEPFTGDPTRYGIEILGITAHWDLSPRFYVELSEGIALESKWSNSYNQTGYGEIYGPREQFTGKIGYRWTLK